MTNAYDQIALEIGTHMAQGGGGFENWYVGVTSDVCRRLFEEHQVRREEEDAWIYREAPNDDIARKVEKYCIDELGTKGSFGGGDARVRFVYAYRIGRHTKR